MALNCKDDLYNVVQSTINISLVKLGKMTFGVFVKSDNRSFIEITNASSSPTMRHLYLGVKELVIRCFGFLKSMYNFCIVRPSGIWQNEIGKLGLSTWSMDLSCSESISSTWFSIVVIRFLIQQNCTNSIKHDYQSLAGCRKVIKIDTFPW